MQVAKIKEQLYSDQLVQDKDVIDQIITAVVIGRRRAIAISNAHRPKNDLGMQTYTLIVEEASRRLTQFGFVKADIGCQFRRQCEVDRYDYPIRFMFCRGKRYGYSQDLRVNEKGLLSGQLVAENQPFSSQLAMQDILDQVYINETRVHFQNYWICWDISGIGDDEVITIYLSLPEKLDAAGRIMRSAELVTLYSGGTFNTAVDLSPDLPTLPEGTMIIPVLEEESTHDEGRV